MITYVLIASMVSLVMIQTFISWPVFAVKEVCYGETRTPEFVCKSGNYYRATDCDQIVGDNGLCYSDDCLVKERADTNKEHQPCANYRQAFLNAMKNEPRCDACVFITPPVFAD